MQTAQEGSLTKGKQRAHLRRNNNPKPSISLNISDFPILNADNAREGNLGLKVKLFSPLVFLFHFDRALHLGSHDNQYHHIEDQVMETEWYLFP